MSDVVLQNGLSALAFSRRLLLSLVEDIPEDKWCQPAVAGHNHTFWILGHMVTTDDHFMTNLGKRQPKCPANWPAMFFMGSTPKPSLADYPAPATIRDHLASSRADLIEWFKSMDPDKLASPLPDDYKVFSGNYGTLMSTMACHESLHAGQLTSIRKSLGLSPVIG